MTTTAIARRAKKQSNHKNRIRELRTARRLTLAQLGKLVGLSEVGVLQCERRDRAGWRLLEHFADALHVSVDQVLGHDRTPPLPVDAFSRQDRELLDAMEHDAEILIGPQVLRLVGGWRRIARFGWLGELQGIRMRETLSTKTGRPIPLPLKDRLRAPKDWFTGWRPQQRARALSQLRNRAKALARSKGAP